MPTFLFKGIKEQGGIRRGARVRVEALPKRNVVFSGKAFGSVALELDEGKYAFSVSHSPEKGPTTKYTGYFLWGVTEDEFQRLKDLEPRAAKKMNTTEGPRFFCQYAGCDAELSSRVASVLHEAEHQGRRDELIAPNEDKFSSPRLVSGEVERARRKLAKMQEQKRASDEEAALMEKVQADLDEQGAMVKNEQRRHAVKAAQKEAEAERPKPSKP